MEPILFFYRSSRPNTRDIHFSTIGNPDMSNEELVIMAQGAALALHHVAGRSGGKIVITQGERVLHTVDIPRN